MTKGSNSRILRRQSIKQASSKWPIKTETITTKGVDDRWYCENCGYVDTQFYTCPNPFAPEGAELTGCMNCRGVNTLLAACHTGDCNELATDVCTRSDGGVAYSCSKHNARCVKREP